VRSESVPVPAAGVERVFAPRGRTRDIVTIGQRWRRRRDGLEVVVRQVHRADRTVDVDIADLAAVPADHVTSFEIPFRVLRAKYRRLGGGR
jgi:hypothetical protein